VDCDVLKHECERYSVNKYPTLRLFYNGEVSRTEYRGERSVQPIVDFLLSQLEVTYLTSSSIEESEQLRARHSKRTVLARVSPGGLTFRSVEFLAHELAADCTFIVQIEGGGAVQEDFHLSDGVDVTAHSAQSEDVVQEIIGFCMPLLREITFENAEALTEEGLPFVILFVKPGDKEVVVRGRTSMCVKFATDAGCRHTLKRRFAIA
jgi:endoplasmic reticulum resident protein 44